MTDLELKNKIIAVVKESLPGIDTLIKVENATNFYLNSPDKVAWDVWKSFAFAFKRHPTDKELDRVKAFCAEVTKLKVDLVEVDASAKKIKAKNAQIKRKDVLIKDEEKIRKNKKAKKEAIKKQLIENGKSPKK